MNGERGITLLELVVVTAIAGLIASLSFPGFATGLDSLRLAQAGDSVAGMLNQAMARSERRQTAVAVTIIPGDGVMYFQSVEPGFFHKLEMPGNVRIAGEEMRRYLLLPGSAPPRMAIELSGRKGARRVVTIDPRISLASATPQP